MFLFQSDLWQYSEKHKLIKNLILDFFRGVEVETVNLAGLSYVISVTAVGDESEEHPKIYFRGYGRLNDAIPNINEKVMVLQLE